MGVEAAEREGRLPRSEKVRRKVAMREIGRNGRKEKNIKGKERT